MVTVEALPDAVSSYAWSFFPSCGCVGDQSSSCCRFRPLGPTLVNKTMNGDHWGADTDGETCSALLGCCLLLPAIVAGSASWCLREFGVVVKLRQEVRVGLSAKPR
jgi:hypothetical protein